MKAAAATPIPGLVDSHCHLDRLNLDRYDGDLDALMRATVAAGVDTLLCIGVELSSFPQVLAVAERYPQVFATVGEHPLYDQTETFTHDQLVTLSAHPRVVGIGETGLDYYRDGEDYASQRERFRTHIRAAADTGLPLVVHTRGAREDTLALLREAPGPVRGVLHCFTEDLAMARAAIEMGFFISISGIVTFANARELREVVQALPLEHLLIETDSPWLAPVPFRGKPNEPRHVAQVAACVAELKGVAVEEVARVTRHNFFDLFRKAAGGGA